MKSVRSMVLISNDPISITRGSEILLSRFQDEIQKHGMTDEISISLVNDLDRSDVSPVVIIYPEAVMYGPIKSDDVAYIVEEHLFKGRIVEEKRVPSFELSGRVAWLNTRKGTLPAENRVVLKNVGLIDPENIEDYIAHDGYQALGLALGSTPTEVITLIKDSGLQGRGGAGFPTGIKWSFVHKTPNLKKYNLQC